jgi:hypothetical protein
MTAYPKMKATLPKHPTLADLPALAARQRSELDRMVRAKVWQAIERNAQWLLDAANANRPLWVTVVLDEFAESLDLPSVAAAILAEMVAESWVGHLYAGAYPRVCFRLRLKGE